MIHRKFFIFLTIALLLISPSIWSAGKSNIKITKVENISVSEIRVRPSLTTADTCIVRHDRDVTWRINGWVTGNELYKSYLDPSLTCNNPYPFSVTEVNMPMMFDSATTITVSVDVEMVDNSNPDCPFPDTIMLGISQTYSLSVPGAGYYDIWIPFDEPIVVNGPFFAGFFIGDISNPNSNPSVVTDDDSLSRCMSYNVWDDTLGFVDLMNNNFYNFPGHLLLYASGMTGGNSIEPVPQVSILSPSNNDSLYKTTEIWIDETSGSSIIDYVSFSYASDSNFVEIGIDYDGTRAFRDGVTQGNNATGYMYNWDFSAVPEGSYTIRVTAVDTLGRTASDDITLFLEPTPPIAQITTPSFGTNFCPSFDILMSSNDENLFSVSLSYKRSEPNFSVNAQTLLLSDFGDFYSSAIAASLAIQALADRGNEYLIREGFNTLTPSQMTYKMADYFSIVSDSGVYDENIFAGLQNFSSTVGNALQLSYQRFPNYLNLRTEIELHGNVALAGIGTANNNWILIDGFNGTVSLDGTYNITISNPVTALIDTVQLRNTGFGSELFLQGSWQPIEITIYIGLLNWDSPLTDFGLDVNRTDGWSFNWTPPNLWQGYDYFIQSKGTDFTSLNGYDNTMLSYDCTKFYLAGDLNNDGVTDINDLTYLINYFTSHGTPPVGGDARADTNCDGYLNITDIVYYANYIFGAAPTPCY